MADDWQCVQWTAGKHPALSVQGLQTGAQIQRRSLAQTKPLPPSRRRPERSHQSVAREWARNVRSAAAAGSGLGTCSAPVVEAMDAQQFDVPNSSPRKKDQAPASGPILGIHVDILAVIPLLQPKGTTQLQNEVMRPAPLPRTRWDLKNTWNIPVVLLDPKDSDIDNHVYWHIQ